MHNESWTILAHQECTSQGAPTYSYFSKPLKNIHFSPTSPLLVLSIPEKHYKFFGFTRLFDLNMKTYFKTTRLKRLRIPSRTNNSRNIFYHSRFLHPGPKRMLFTTPGFSTLTANSRLQIIQSKNIFDRQVYPS